MQVRDTEKIDPALTVHDVMSSRPETAAVFRSYGIDTCCGAKRTLTEAAKAAGLDEAALLRELELASVGSAA